MNDFEMNRRIKMILQAYDAGYLEKFKAWEELEKVIQEWTNSKKKAPKVQEP